LRTPAAASCPTIRRSSATEWSTAGEVGQRRQRRVGGDPLGHRDRAVAGRAAGAVRHRDEVGAQRLELADRRPQLALALVGLGREELEGEQREPRSSMSLIVGLATCRGYPEMVRRRPRRTVTHEH
jgi:hypothetical protein